MLQNVCIMFILLFCYFSTIYNIYKKSRHDVQNMDYMDQFITLQTRQIFLDKVLL